MPGVHGLEVYEIMAGPNEALRMILPIAGWRDGQAADVVFTGGADPVLPTPFRIGVAGAATLAATGLAATELWQARTGRRPTSSGTRSRLPNTADISKMRGSFGGCFGD